MTHSICWRCEVSMRWEPGAQHCWNCGRFMEGPRPHFELKTRQCVAV